MARSDGKDAGERTGQPLDGARTLALAALYSAYKRLKRAGAPLAEDAEFLHAHARDRDWNESYYFNFVDPERGVGGYTRIGILPNQDHDLAVIMLFGGGRRLLVAHEPGRATADENGVRAGRLAYRLVHPLEEWRLTFSGEMLSYEDSRLLPAAPPAPAPPGIAKPEKVELDLTFRGLGPCFNYKDADPRALAGMLVKAGTRLRDLRAVSRVSSEHYEQAGRVTGRLSIGGEGHGRFEGGGHRDHSWGVRDWSAPRCWTWLTCQFPGGPAFNLSRVAIRSIDMFNGFVCRDGRNHPLKRAWLETEFEEDGVTQKALRFRLEDTGGGAMEVSGEVLTVIPLDLRARGHSTLVNEALTRYRCNGLTGVGISEYLHQV